MPSKALKTIQKMHLFSRKPVYFADVLYERKNHNAFGVTLTGLNSAEQTTARKAQAKDLNTDDTISLFQEQLKKEYVYRIPLRYFSDIGKLIF